MISVWVKSKLRLWKKHKYPTVKLSNFKQCRTMRQKKKHLLSSKKKKNCDFHLGNAKSPQKWRKSEFSRILAGFWLEIRFSEHFLLRYISFFLIGIHRTASLHYIQKLFPGMKCWGLINSCNPSSKSGNLVLTKMKIRENQIKGHVGQWCIRAMNDWMSEFFFQMNE